MGELPFVLPVEMQKDLMIDVRRQDRSPRTRSIGRTIDQLRISISRSFVFREWLKPVVGKPAEAGWKAAEIACFHQLKLVANRESAEADTR